MRWPWLSEAEFDRRLAIEMAEIAEQVRKASLPPPAELEAQAIANRHATAEAELAEWRLARERDEAERDCIVLPPEPPIPPSLPCTCGSVHFTAGGQVVTPRTDGKLHPDGGVLSCVRCGRRWAHCGSELLEPHEKALPPAWAAVDLHQRVQESQAGSGRSPAEFRRVREATRRASDSLRPPPRRGS